MRLNIPAGTAVRFEPGDTREVELVELGGSREVLGLNRLVEEFGHDESPARQPFKDLHTTSYMREKHHAHGKTSLR